MSEIDQPWLALQDAPYVLAPSVIAKISAEYGDVRGVQVRIKYRGSTGYICAVRNRPDSPKHWVLVYWDSGGPPVWMEPDELLAHPGDGLDEYVPVP
jgi:hypothetical protein